MVNECKVKVVYYGDCKPCIGATFCSACTTTYVSRCYAL